MNKLTFVILIFSFLSFGVKAFHIVGGEMELVHVNGFTYNINLIQYFDRYQGGNVQNFGPEGNVTVFIYKNGSTEIVDTFVLNLISDATVPYTSDECAIGELQTSRPFFSATVTLDPAKYSDPVGYYMVWERCCRNASVVNINNASGTVIGMTYVLDFPAIMKDGEPFINSSPQLFPPLSDYACINQLYYANFRGTDPDGDSLVYSISVPLNSSTNNPPTPPPSPKPHFAVNLANGFDVDNLVPGDPSLQISSDGFLTVNPSSIGLYVFSVLVEEYRDQVKIGQVTRDFQMLVLDGCDPPAPPNAEVRLPDETEFYNEVDTIRFTVADEKCFEFLVTDDVGEQVTLRAEGVNFTGDVSDIFDFNQGFINANQDTLRVEVCVPECPYVREIPYIIDLIAADNACPLPQLDTVRLVIEVKPPPNEIPSFVIPERNRTVVVPENDSYSEVFNAIDTDGDNLVARLIPSTFEGFSPRDFGMSLELVNTAPGQLDVQFNWDTDCQMYDFGTRNHFDMLLIVDDLDFCSEFEGDTIFYDLNVVLPPNTSPNVTSSLAGNSVQAFQGTTISFDVNVNDADGDEISLNMLGNGFDPNQFDINFQNQTGIGNANSRFEWNLDCQPLGLTENSSFVFYFFSEDEDDCREINTDTLEVRVDVLVPFNSQPEFETYSDYELVVNEEFSLDITANDADNGDFLNIDILSGTEIPPSPSFLFNGSSGQASTSSTLEWTPECGLLGNNFSPQSYTVFFLTWDDSCPEVKYDTLSINFLVKELDVEYDSFLPPNVFTPNGDNRNDVYTLNGLLETNSNLPPDNCEDQFQSIFVFDRSGKQVFRSTDRNFIWTGDDLPSGVYYYSIEYLNSDYQGTITILY